MNKSLCLVCFAFVVSIASFAPRCARADVGDDSAVSYTDSVRAALDRGKHFPTGREVSIEQPTGRSEVTFSLTRGGKVASAKTTRSSNSMPLDDMARQLVHRAKYPAFPETAWAGSPTHTFVVAYNFSRNPQGRVTVGDLVEVKAK
jgi:TonB family protein